MSRIGDLAALGAYSLSDTGPIDIPEGAEPTVPPRLDQLPAWAPMALHEGKPYVGSIATGTTPWKREDIRMARLAEPRHPIDLDPDTNKWLAENVVDTFVPQSPADLALMAVTGGTGKAVKAIGGKALQAGLGSIGAYSAFGSTEAEAGIANRVKKVAAKMGDVLKVDDALPRRGNTTRTELEHVASPDWINAPYIQNPQRVANPGVYGRPDEIAKEAAARVAPEHPALKELFGVTRDDLYDISQQGRRQGNIETELWQPNKPGKPNEAALSVMNPANEQRLIDTLTEARKHPGLERGMVPWYVMDPLYQQMVKLVGPERAAKEFRDFNMSMTPFSAGSSVPAEINRGTAANMMRQRGEYDTFLDYGGLAANKRDVAGYPEILRDVKGMMGHRNQANPVQRYVDTGSHGYGDDNVKISLYSDASGVPQTGFQTRGAVPDAHFTRAVGVPDARKNPNDFNEYMIGTEYRQIGPWYRDKVAKPLGIEAVPAQALMWGTYGPQTGVKTAIGAGKLELLSKAMWERAQKLGIDPKVLRDQVLRGEQHSSLAPAAVLGALAAQDNYQSA